MIKNAVRVLILASSIFVGGTSAGSMPDAVCPDAGYFNNLINSFCWSCTLPFNLAGFSDNVPKGANDSALCSCSDALGVPELGVSLGYWSPDHLVEVSATPWCSPTLGGTLMQNDLTMRGRPSNPETQSAETISFLHYNYIINPVFKMLGLFLLPECDTSPGFFDLDIAYMSILDITYENSALSFLFTPDAIPIANPIGRATCVADGMLMTSSGSANESLWFCAGLDGPLYPLTGFIHADNDFIRNTQLITTRSLAALHRRGLARKTYGKDAMCSPEYSPMIPKAQYKISMMYPSPEANPAAASAAKPDKSANSEGDSQSELDGSWDECCHPLGWPTIWWGAGRKSVGNGKDQHAVYSIFRYTDCCVRM
ncbi:TraU family protein [Shewanella sp. SM101]|jgi:conjugal transfer pilus assembly protein TraU|uniref:TraU family protein n=1 Tax=Shewanella TaxID=22 RepID=UPI0021DB775A|nr:MULTISPECIES: TraU family protein [unclassified Shewanella]MCU8009945.1 TraU family protein [Shewanella sp. SM87]MCU8107101.1 TraU family protein [Shewanella sp. SM101]